MPAPINSDAEHATAITLPASLTQAPHFGGLSYDLWFTFEATETGEIAAFGFGDLTDYAPQAQVYLGPASSPTELLPIAGTNVPIQFPVTLGVRYYLKFSGASVPASVLTLLVDRFTPQSVPRGALCINDDTIGFPLAILSPTTGQPLAFQQHFPAGEHGVAMPSGQVIVHNIDIHKPQIFNASRALVATLDLFGYLPVTCNATSFYAGFPYNGATETTIKKISPAGVISTTYTPTPTVGLVAMGVNAAGTILYYVESNAANQPVKRWNLSTDLTMANLVAGLASFKVTRDVVVLRDDTILVAYLHASDPTLSKVVHYSTAGAVLHTYVIAHLNRICTSLDDPTTFIAWSQTAPTSTFTEVLIASGASVVTTTGTIFNLGSSAADPSATPPARYGHSSSCPIWVTRTASHTTTTYPKRVQRRFLLPSSPDNKTMQIPVLELLTRTGVGLNAGSANDPPVQGSDPKVWIRISKDGGKTWSLPKMRSIGALGRYADRVRWLRATGNYRNAVLEITASDAVSLQWLAMLAPNGVTEGTS